MPLLKEYAGFGRFSVKYAVTTPSGSTAQFQRMGSIMDVPMQAKSETAILAYLQQQHPGTKVTILDLNFFDS